MLFLSQCCKCWFQRALARVGGLAAIRKGQVKGLGIHRTTLQAKPASASLWAGLVAEGAEVFQGSLNKSPGSWLALQWGWREEPQAPAAVINCPNRDGKSMHQGEAGWATGFKGGHTGADIQPSS